MSTLQLWGRLRSLLGDYEGKSIEHVCRLYSW